MFKEDYDGAIGDIKEAIRLDPADTDYHEALAKLEQTLEQFKRKDKPGLLGSLASAAWKVMIGLAVASEVAEGACTRLDWAMKMPLGALICPYCRLARTHLVLGEPRSFMHSRSFLLTLRTPSWQSADTSPPNQLLSPWMLRGRIGAV